ncbi:unnamed protein product [Rotaria sordida]|uniref:NAD(P)(+)--arginine ADP-ribosyltransferase n=1 Tax=Rotaria sordida TaxID=392033 RepID=A0A814JXU4_9BILA|nr:unnamed protein product [Rotaria sordida]CAF1043426.1 unnamed protein product [Rotaria sordida]
MDNTQQRLQKVCTKIGYTSVVIRQLNDYIPSSDRHSSLLPYAELLFKNEDPHYICRFIKKLSPIRLYVYGNMLRIHSEWSKLMIATEIDIMDDEDDWCAFLENEYVEDEVKWNFGFIFGREWKVSRVSPLNFTHLDENLRFHSALRRAHATFAPRQVEVTAKIFDWHANCIKQGYLQEEPKLTDQLKSTKYDQHIRKILQNVEDVSSLLPLPITVYNPEQPHLFMAHQRTIDSLLCMPHTSESKAEMLTEFRRIFDDNQEILAEIDEFEDTYHSHAAVQWYTRDSFVCRTINQALRSSNVEAMFKLRYILTDLYAHLKESYRQMHWYLQTSRPEIFYRGQGMSREEFDSFQELRGSIISINTFLSTTASMQIALLYAGKYHENSNLISVVFSIETNPKALIRPYANISPLSMFQDEEETLFAMGSVYRIGNIRPLPDADNVWVIYLQTIHQDDDRFYRISSATS